MINAEIFKLGNKEQKYIARNFLQILENKAMNFIYGLQVKLNKHAMV